MAVQAEAPAVGGTPKFFFSYSRANSDHYLASFLDVLRSNVKGKLGGPIEEICVDDKDGVLAGAYWESDLGNALRSAAVFVAVYSPDYFRRQQNKVCYCGKEFRAFLERTRWDAQGSAPVSHIVPVLWVVGPSPFPPAIPPVARTNYNTPGPSIKAFDTYHQHGLQRVWQSMGKREAVKIVDAVVDRIVQLANNPPPLLPEPVLFATTPCAFHDDDEEIDAVPPASPQAISSDAGPRRVVLVYCADGEAESVLDAGSARVHEIAYRQGFDPQPLRWTPDNTGVLLRTVRAASSVNQVPMVIISGAPGHHGRCAEEVRDAIREGEWIGGVAVRGSDSPPMSSSKDVLVRALRDGPVGEHDLVEFLAELRSRMAQLAPVRTPPPPYPGPDHLPRL